MSIFDELQNCDVKRAMEKAEESRNTRVIQAFELAAENSYYELLKYYALFALGRNTEYADEQIYKILTSDDSKVREENFLDDRWSLLLNMLLIRIYYYFGGIISPKLKECILSLLWERMKYENDIAIARDSTWNIIGSENHDINSKACALITSQIFMENEDYKDRVYPDEGKGGGDGYWFHYMYKFMGSNTPEDFGPKGGADMSDGKEYHAKEHYEQWVKFWKEYFKERVKRGFFLEMGATGYMKWTMSFISLIYEFCADRELKATVKAFMDLVWCDWAVEQIDGVRGGSKTRFVFEEKEFTDDSMRQLAEFYFGGKGNAGHVYYFQLLSDYRLPELVWQLASSREKLGSFEYISRKPGEEQALYPRPRGYERSMMCDTEARFVRYSYITPNFVLGTQMDAPYAVHSHLSAANRYNGLVIKGNKHIFPSVFGREGGSLEPVGDMYRSVQKNGVLISAFSRCFFQINPDWFPKRCSNVQYYGFYVSPGVNVTEENGWLFVYEGNVCAAFRPAYGGFFMSGNNVIFNDYSAPAIIEASDSESASEFKKRITENALEIRNTVVPGYYTIKYISRGIAYDFNAANEQPPAINGEYVNYEYPYTFYCPYIKSEYNSGKVEVSVNGMERTFVF